jgi:hypothetical protein
MGMISNITTTLNLHNVTAKGTIRVLTSYKILLKKSKKKVKKK